MAQQIVKFSTVQSGIRGASEKPWKMYYVCSCHPIIAINFCAFTFLTIVKASLYFDVTQRRHTVVSVVIRV